MISKCLTALCLACIGAQASANGFIVGSKRIGGVVNLVRMNLDGSGEAALTSFSTDAYGPSISPDGSKILFHSWHTGSAQIFAMNSDGSGLQQLTFDSLDNLFPSWSPDGTSIVFQRGLDTVMDLYVMDADGSNQVNITNTPGVFEVNADWSRSTGQIAFSRAGDIWSMQSNGAAQTRLTAGGGDEWSAKWSPDGTQIAYHAQAGGPDWRGWMMGADGSNQHVFTQLLGSHAFPDYWDANRVLLHAVASGGNPEGLVWLGPDGSNLQLIREGVYVGGTAWIATPVPEPFTMGLAGLALASAARRRFRKSP